LIIALENVDRLTKLFHSDSRKNCLFNITGSSTSLYLCNTTLRNLNISIAADFNGELHMRLQNSSC